MEVNNNNLAKLHKVFKEHGKIIIGVDFDDTVFPLDPECASMCKAVRLLLQECKVYSILCLYTVADTQSLEYKKEIMSLWGIPVDYVNESPVKLGDGSKPYFNILLDDKAGLYETYLLLQKFNNQL
tara:strand:- start:1119 stop:1496 length:378 start_codon:yes stop_codon:yes gene_type:complete